MTFQALTKKLRSNKEVRKAEMMYRKAFNIPEKNLDFKRSMIKKYTAERNELLKHLAELHDLYIWQIHEIFDGIRIK